MGKFIGIFLLVAVCLHSYSQTVDLRFKGFDLNDELSSHQINDLAQDEFGFVWLGTNNGLFRFDGRELKKYLTPEELNFGINEYGISQILPDNNNGMWISLNSYLCYYNQQTDSIRVIVSQNRTKGLKSSYVSRMLYNRDSTIYFVESDGIYQYIAQADSFKIVFRLGKGFVSGLSFDMDNNLWISENDDNQVFFFNQVSKQYKQLNIPQHLNPEGKIVDIVYRKGFLWIGTQYNGVIRYNIEQDSFKQYSVQNEYEKHIRRFFIDRDNFLWLIDFTSLKLYVEDRDFFQGYYPESNDDQSILPYVHRIFQDKDHNYWTTHYPGGIAFATRPQKISRFNAQMNSPFKLNTNNVSAICEDVDGNLWVGNPFSGIDIFYWAKGRTIHIENNTNDATSLGRGAVQTIFRDSKNRMWVGTYFGGLQLYEPDRNSFVNYTHNPQNEKGISANDVRAICEDKEGMLWLCIHGKGVDKFNPQTGEFINFNIQNNGLSNDYTFDVVCDSLGNIWVATAWGLSVLRKGEGRFDTYYLIENDSSSLSNNLVIDLHIDAAKRLWLGTANGLNQYLPESNNFRRFISKLPNQNVISINNDIDNNIWTGTYNGLSILNPETNQLITLSKEDGLISNNFAPRANYNNGKNTLFWGTEHGLNYFNVGELELLDKAPDVYITGLKIFNQPIDVHNSKLIDRNILFTESIELTHKHRMIEVSYAAINYKNPSKNNYAYRLDGFDNEWNEVGSRQTATYTNLKPGKYIFRVKAANAQGVWNEHDASLIVNIEPPFWNTLIFKITAIVLIFLLVAGITYMRQRKLIRDKIRLEKKVKLRTKEVRKQNIKLEAQKTDLEKANRLKNHFFSILAHDLRSPVSSLVQITQLLKEQKIEDNNCQLNLIESAETTSQNVLTLLEDLLLWGKTQSGSIEIVIETGNLLTLVNESLEFFDELSKTKKVAFHVDVEPSLQISTDLNYLKVVLRNLLSNALKFSHLNSTIQIIAGLNSQNITISVIDQGVGMSQKVIDDFNHGVIKHSTRGTQGESGTGLGLSLCKELVAYCKGTMQIQSVLKQGTTVQITFPLAKA
ncbi:MAG: hypothetical protein JW735_07035 [Prolixibacteraceae bacterium]|nr:hypothetical protein [Prolixibacteraceae bacterium]